MKISKFWIYHFSTLCQGQYGIEISTNSVNGKLAIVDDTIGTINVVVTGTGGTLSISSPIIRLETDLTVNAASATDFGYELKGSFNGADFTSLLDVQGRV